MMESDIKNQMNQSQRRRLLYQLAMGGGFGRLLMFLLIILFFFGVLIFIVYVIANPKDKNALFQVAGLVAFALIYGVYMWKTTINDVLMLLEDYRNGEVIQDCGVITLSAQGKAKGGGRTYIRVDDIRVYDWNSGIKGEFTEGKEGCVCYAPYSKIVFSIETFESTRDFETESS